MRSLLAALFTVVGMVSMVGCADDTDEGVQADVDAQEPAGDALPAPHAVRVNFVTGTGFREVATTGDRMPELGAAKKPADVITRDVR